MADSILTDVKKVLGLADEYDVFDQDIIMHINSVFSTLNQLGVGPENGFEITDKTATWDTFLGSNTKFNFVKTYIYLKVRMVFDPPSTGYTQTAFDKQIQELEWRINVLRESTAWVYGAMSDVGSILSISFGMPLHKRFRVTDGKNIWSNLSDVEATLRIRAEQDPRSQVLVDLSPYVSCSFDQNDILADWEMTGQQTATLPNGFFDLVLSDVGSADAQAIKIFSGYVQGGV